MADRVIASDSEVGAIAFVGGANTLAGVCRDGQLRLWDAGSGVLKRSLPWDIAGIERRCGDSGLRRRVLAAVARTEAYRPGICNPAKRRARSRPRAEVAPLGLLRRTAAW